MPELMDKHVLVLGLGPQGHAACVLLAQSGACVSALDTADTPALREAAAQLAAVGVRAELGVTQLPAGAFDLAIVSPGILPGSIMAQELHRRSVPIIGELELAYRHARCLMLAVTGTNGKSTTVRLIEAVLRNEHRTVAACGSKETPFCAAVGPSKELDYLIVAASAFQLEMTECFRPSVAVLTNLAADHLDRYDHLHSYARAVARVFANQQPFDWAIVQWDALATLKQLGVAPQGKVITFSAEHREADLYFDRGLLLSRLPGWEGPLLDTDRCRLRGLQNAENLLAALGVGHALRVSLESMSAALCEATALPHTGELVAEHRGVHFINNSKARNVHALEHALRSVPVAAGGMANIWLIAGGRDKGLDFHATAPLISRRVKGAFLVGEAREKLRAAWGLFAPCLLMDSVAAAVAEAAKGAQPGDTVLLAPGCSSLDQFGSSTQRGEAFEQAVAAICGGDNA